MKISNFVQNMKFQQSPEEETRNYILSLARDLNLDTGHSFPLNVLFHKTISFNTKQKEALAPALESLIQEGIFEDRDGKNPLSTEKGRDILY